MYLSILVLVSNTRIRSIKKFSDSASVLKNLRLQWMIRKKTYKIHLVTVKGFAGWIIINYLKESCSLHELQLKRELNEQWEQ